MAWLRTAIATPQEEAGEAGFPQSLSMHFRIKGKKSFITFRI